MKLLSLTTMALPIAFGNPLQVGIQGRAKQCSCAIQGLLDEAGDFSKEMQSKGYHMDHYNDFFNFYADEALPILAQTCMPIHDYCTIGGHEKHDDDFVWSWEEYDQDFNEENFRRDTGLTDLANVYNDEMTQQVLAANETRNFWNSINGFYVDCRDYTRETVIGRLEPEFSAYIGKIKDSPTILVNASINVEHARAFHPFLIKWLSSTTGAALTADFKELSKNLQKIAPPLQDFQEYMDKKFGRIARMMRMGRGFDNNIDYKKIGREAEESVHEAYENAIGAMIDDGSDFANYEAMFEEIVAHIETAMSDPEMTELIEANMDTVMKIVSEEPEFDFVKLFKILDDVVNTAWFQKLMNEIADIPQYLAGEITLAELENVFTKYQAVFFSDEEHHDDGDDHDDHPCRTFESSMISCVYCDDICYGFEGQCMDSDENSDPTWDECMVSTCVAEIDDKVQNDGAEHFPGTNTTDVCMQLVQNFTMYHNSMDHHDDGHDDGNDHPCSNIESSMSVCNDCDSPCYGFEEQCQDYDEHTDPTFDECMISTCEGEIDWRVQNDGAEHFPGTTTTDVCTELVQNFTIYNNNTGHHDEHHDEGDDNDRRIRSLLDEDHSVCLCKGYDGELEQLEVDGDKEKVESSQGSISANVMHVCAAAGLYNLQKR